MSATDVANVAPDRAVARPRTWVLLRGLAREAGHWHDLPASLEARTGERVLTPDLPGVGKAARWRSPWSVPAIAANVASRVRDQLDGNGAGDTEVVLVGHSLGGMVALAWAAFGYEPRPAALVVSCASARDIAPFFWRMRLAMLPNVAHAAVTRDIRDRERLILEMTSSLEEGDVKHRTLNERVSIATDRPMRKAVVLRQLVAAAKFNAPHPDRIPCPMRVVVSDGDEFVDPICSDRIAYRYQADIRRHDDAGHDIALDDPRWFLDAITASIA